MKQVNQSAFEIYRAHYNDLSIALTNGSSPSTFPDLPIKVYPSQKSISPRILLLGINPSFSDSVFQKFQGEERSECSDWFSWTAMVKAGIAGEEYARIASYDQAVADYTGKGEHPYFKAIRSFLQEVFGENFDVQRDLFHFDLFQFRCTSQKEFVKALGRMNNRESFVEKSFALLKKTIDTVQPSMILVANAQVGKWLLEAHPEMKKHGFDEQWGCYHFGEKALWLAAQLSGGVTDRFSRERLAWAIRRYVHEHPSQS